MLTEKYTTIADTWQRCSSEYSDLPFTKSIDNESFTYKQSQSITAAVAEVLDEAGLKLRDRVILLSENRAEWGLIWLGIVCSGRTAVPVMTDFSKEQINNIIGHSEASYIWVSEKLRDKLDDTELFRSGAVSVIDGNSVFGGSGEPALRLPTLPGDFGGDETASLIYTSGTTGLSKGVLLSHRNILTNSFDSAEIGKLNPGDAMLSVLPLAHMYEFTQGFMTPMVSGANISYLGSKPTPAMLLKALKKVRPHFMLSVPLLIEKIYKNSVLSSLSSNPVLKTLYGLPPLRFMLNRFVIGKKLNTTFGGRLKFFGIGGAPLTPAVERFLREARFPYAIGYGLTETSPCLAGSAPFKTIFKGIGPAMRSVRLRIGTGGEIQARGASIMKGYFKDPERTKQTFTEDGWFKTGDIGRIDRRGNLYIMGRLKNLILGPSGENIYPEEIENRLKANPLVSECIVLKNRLGLVARVFLDEDKLKKQYNDLKENVSHFPEWKEKTLEDLRQSVNKSLANFSRLNNIIEQTMPFELTPSLKVKRYLYE